MPEGEVEPSDTWMPVSSLSPSLWVSAVGGAGSLMATSPVASGSRPSAISRFASALIVAFDFAMSNDQIESSASTCVCSVSPRSSVSRTVVRSRNATLSNEACDLRRRPRSS